MQLGLRLYASSIGLYGLSSAHSEYTHLGGDPVSGVKNDGESSCAGAPDWRDSPAFSCFFYAQALSSPANQQVTRTVSTWRYFLKGKFQWRNLMN